LATPHRIGSARLAANLVNEKTSCRLQRVGRLLGTGAACGPCRHGCWNTRHPMSLNERTFLQGANLVQVQCSFSLLRWWPAGPRRSGLNPGPISACKQAGVMARTYRVFADSLRDGRIELGSSPSRRLKQPKSTSPLRPRAKRARRMPALGAGSFPYITASTSIAW